MNYFIDFDHTLYNTRLLINRMLLELAKYIAEQNNIDFQNVFNDLQSTFNHGKNGINDIYKLIEELSHSSNYNFDKKKANTIIDNVLLYGNNFLYEDSISFLKYLKSHGNMIYILSYNENDLYFQSIKIAGSGILEFVDGVIPTTVLKGNMPLDFENSVFIDDKPEDLISIYNQKPKKIYRIRRIDETYSNKETNLSILEYTSLSHLEKCLKMEE